jgi:autotransporter-associated beta strand protein
MRLWRDRLVMKSVGQRAALAALLAAVAGFTAQEAHATDYTWGNVSTDFNTNANWTPSGFPSSGSDKAIFDAAATVQPNISASATVNAVRFGLATSTGYTLSAASGQALTLTSTGATSTLDATHAALVGLNTTLTNTISAPIVLGAALNSTQTFIQGTAGTMILSGPISQVNNVNLQYLGSGSFEVSNANSYTGNTIIGAAASGTLTKVKITNGDAFGTAASTVTINSNGNTASSTLFLAGGITVNNKALVINGSNVAAFSSTGNNFWTGSINAATSLSRIESLSGLLTLSGLITLSNSSANNIVFQGDGNITATNTISGVGTLTKSSGGTGTLTLSGANTYTGVTTISNGTISASSLNSVVGPAASSSLGRPTTATNGTISIGSTATSSVATLKYTGTGETTDRVINLSSDNKAAQIDQSGTGLLKFISNFTATTVGAKTLTLTGSTAGTGEISGAIVNSSGVNVATSINKTGTGTWTLSGTNTNSGTATVTAGTLRTASANALGFGSLSSSTTTSGGTSVVGGATLDIAGQTLQEVITLNGTGVGGNGALINSSATPTTIGSGLASLSLTATGSGYSAAPTVTIGGPGTGAAATALLGLTNLSFGVTAGGTGYTTSSVVTISGGGGTGATANVVLSGSTLTGFTITNPGSGYTSAPTVAVSIGTGATFSNNATSFIVSGVRLTAAGSGYMTAPTVTLTSGGTTATATANRTGVVLASDSSIGGTGNITVDGIISGGFALTKVGANTLMLNAANTYSGTTTVNAGTLAVNNATGSGTGTAGVLVNSTGTLAGNGFISGAVNITGGTLSPGNSVDSLDTGTLSFTGGTFAAEINTTASTADLVNVTGDLNLASSPSLSLTDLGANVALTAGTVFTLVDYSGTWNAGIFAGRADDSTFIFGANSFKIDYNDPNFAGTALTLTVQAIPEPSTLVLGGLALLGFAGAGLRRRRIAMTQA